MTSQVLYAMWCNISGEAAGETWYWSLLGVKGLTLHPQSWSFWNFPCSLAINIIPHSMENLAFHIAYSDERWTIYYMSMRIQSCLIACCMVKVDERSRDLSSVKYLWENGPAVGITRVWPGMDIIQVTPKSTWTASWKKWRKYIRT